MSRIGRSQILLDSKITCESVNGSLKVKGAKASLVVPLSKFVTVETSAGKLIVKRINETKEAKSHHGMTRALIQNAVIGVTSGFSKGLELHGVGYRANVAGKKLELSLGFSHPISFEIPEGIEIKVDKQTAIMVSGADKSLVGLVSAKIRSFRPPEPYLGKGVRYTGEVIRKKAGKSAGK